MSRAEEVWTVVIAGPGDVDRKSLLPAVEAWNETSGPLIGLRLDAKTDLADVSLCVTLVAGRMSCYYYRRS
jgi:hypothetical protein